MPHPFDRAEYLDETFRGLEWPSISLEGIEFDHCTFRACRFPDSTFRRCKFLGCTFKDCDLSLIQVPYSAFGGTRFEGCKLAGVDWTKGYWPRLATLEPMTFVDCTLNYATFIGLNLKELTLSRCTAHDADFSDAALTRAVCTGTDFTASRFTGADLSEADFTGATNYTIDATRCKLKRTRFALPEAIALLRGLDIILVDPDEPGGK